MRITFFITLLFFCNSTFSQFNPPWNNDPSPTPLTFNTDSASQYRHRTFYSAVHGVDIGYVVVLPAAYMQDSTVQYPVTYWLHGGVTGPYYENSISWITDDRFEENATYYPSFRNTIHVFPNGLDLSYWTDHINDSTQIETALITELVPIIDSLYNISPDRACRGVAGHSMGGYAAIKYLFKYPQLFGHATSIDGSIYPSLNHQPNYVDDPAFPYYFSFMGSDTTFFNKTSVYSWVDTFFASTPTPPGKLFILAGSSEPLENYSAQAFVDYLSSVHSYTAKFFVDPNMEHPFDNFLMAYGDSIYNFQNTATCDSVQSPTLPPASIGFKHGIENAILMYPNPALNKITISISELHASQFTLSVSDLTGRVLQNHSFIGREYELNLASLTPGVYLIEVSSEMTKRTYRIIKK